MAPIVLLALDAVLMSQAGVIFTLGAVVPPVSPDAALAAPDANIVIPVWLVELKVIAER